MTEAQVIELLESFGKIKAFDLVRDRETGNSKGYGFAVYQDPAVTDAACQALNGMSMADKVLTVRRATASGQPKPGDISNMILGNPQLGLMGIGAIPGVGGTGANMIPLGVNPLGAVNPLMPVQNATDPGPITRIVSLSSCVTVDELKDDTEYEEIVEDMREECSKYGTVKNITIPRPQDGGDVKGVGMVFVEYEAEGSASSARAAMQLRKFGGNMVIASFFPGMVRG